VTVHEAFKSQIVSWIESKLSAIADNDAQSRLFVNGIIFGGSSTFFSETPGKERVLIRHDPDSVFMYTRWYFPTVVLEYAISPGPKSLNRLAHDYIQRSRGRVRAVVGFELDKETKKVSLTVWRPHYYMQPKGLTVGAMSEGQVSA
jgi:hypothetical protein